VPDPDPRIADQLPVRLPAPRPRGWFELFCCATILLVFVGALIAIALISSR
jgi:hypothetical protein